MKVKICGLSCLADIEAVNAVRPDWIGFVFAKKSRRYIRPEQAALLKERLNQAVKAAGVFGFILMTGPSSTETVFEPDIFSVRRIKVAPVVCFLGFIFMIYAVLRKPKIKIEE